MAAKSAYDAPRREIIELFADYLEGDDTRPALAISEHALPEIARNAIERSLEAFGRIAPTCSYVTLTPLNPQTEGGDIPLDPQALFLLVEAIDPLFIIAADKASTDRLSQAYHGNTASNRIFGRPAATFADLPSLLATELGKQKAWRALKSLKG